MAIIGLGLVLLGAALRPGRASAKLAAPVARLSAHRRGPRQRVAALLLKVLNTFRSMRNSARLRLSFLPTVK